MSYESPSNRKPGIPENEFLASMHNGRLSLVALGLLVIIFSLCSKGCKADESLKQPEKTNREVEKVPDGDVISNDSLSAYQARCNGQFQANVVRLDSAGAPIWSVKCR